MGLTFPSPTKKWHQEVYSSISPTRPELSAKGKSVVVTGGGTGIGAEIVRYFAEAGAARIAILGRREQPLLETKASVTSKFPGVEVFTASTDVTNQSQVNSAFETFAGEGKIDVLVSNAAVAGPRERVEEVDTVKAAESIQQNTLGAMNVAKAFLRLAATDAVVVNVSSNAAHMNVGAAYAAYSAAKLAVVRIWDAIASGNPELSIYHIHPGIVDTDMNREAGGVAAFGYEDQASLPAGFSVWLASPEAKFLKNKFLWTNWDVDELKARAKELEGSQQLSVALVGWPFQEDGSWKAPDMN